MVRGLFKVIVITAALTGSADAGWAIDFSFAPDTAAGNAGQTVLMSGRIGPSDPLRGFTVYMTYDTNLIDLSEPPVPGSLIADRQGLQFNYFDHVPIHPNRLEIGGTVFSTDFWSGPGEIFQVRFSLRECADAPITSAGAPFFVDANGNYPAVNFYPAVVLICDRIPAPVSDLTIYPADDCVILRWSPVTSDTLGRPLLVDPRYVICRQQILPSPQPAENIATVPDTIYVDTYSPGLEYIYDVITECTP